MVLNNWSQLTQGAAKGILSPVINYLIKLPINHY